MYDLYIIHHYYLTMILRNYYLIVMNISNSIPFLSIEPHNISALKMKTLFANGERKT